MSSVVESLEADLASIVGESKISSDPAVCFPFAVDGLVPRHVVYPGSGEQVAQVLKCTAHHDLAVIPCRSGSKLGIGNVPRRYDVALSLKDMNQVWHYEPEDLTISTEAGMKLGDFQHFVGRHHLWLPLDPPGGARASLGGVAATNSAGPLRLRYGAPRDMIVGMTVATTEGKLVKTGGRVVKNVAGYDLAKLLIGSYGTLGVIVEINLKLYPKVPERTTFVLRPGTLEVAKGLRRKILNSPLQPLRMVLLDAEAFSLLRAQAAAGEAELWIEAGGSAPVLRRYEEAFTEWSRAAGVPNLRLNSEMAESGWARIGDLHTWLVQVDPGIAIFRATLPITTAEDFIQRTHQLAKEENLRLACFSQVGIGIVHLGVMGQPDTASLAGLVGRVRTAAAGLVWGPGGRTVS